MRRLAILFAITCAAPCLRAEDVTTTRAPAAPWARPSESPYDVGYYVGGGVGKRVGEPRQAHEGTWGWDYGGLLPKRVALWWSHGRRSQGGVGAYRTAGTTISGRSSP